MPVTKDALRRYKVIDKMLSDPNQSYTTEQIWERVNGCCPRVSLRMIQKDIKALEEEFGKAMVRNSGRRGTVRYEDQSEPLFYQELSPDEEQMLREVLRSLGRFEGLDNFTWLELLNKRLGERACESEAPIISFSKNESLQVPATLLGRLFTAISQKKVIALEYTPFGKRTRSYKVYPYQLKQFNDRWFLLCTPLVNSKGVYEKDFILTLALDRMSEEFSYLENEPYVSTTVDLRARFDEIIGVTLDTSKEVEEIIFAVSPERVNYVRTKGLHLTQYEYDEQAQAEFRAKHPAFSDWTLFSIECRENPELYTMLSSFGDSIVVLGPDYIKENLLGKLTRAVENYSM